MVRSMKPQGSRRAASVAAGRGAAAVARAESKTEAYARIREQRAKTAAKRRREEAAAEAGGVGQFLSQAVGALDFQEDVKVRRPSPGPRPLRGSARKLESPEGEAGLAAGRTEGEVPSSGKERGPGPPRWSGRVDGAPVLTARPASFHSFRGTARRWRACGRCARGTR